MEHRKQPLPAAEGEARRDLVLCLREAAQSLYDGAKGENRLATIAVYCSEGADALSASLAREAQLREALREAVPHFNDWTLMEPAEAADDPTSAYAWLQKYAALASPVSQQEGGK